MIYECDQCRAALPPRTRACPQCGEVFEDAVPADAELPPRGFSAAPARSAPPLPPPSPASHSNSYDWLDAPSSPLPSPPLPADQRQARAAAKVVAGIVLLCGGWVAYSAVKGGDLSSNTPGEVAGAATSAVSQAVDPTHAVTYKVTGTTASASVTYENATGGTEQVAGVTLPWSKSFKAKGGSFLYLCAQNQNANGDLTVEIDVDGTPRKSATASGAYVIADTNGTL